MGYYKSHKLDKIVNSFILILLVANQFVQCASDELDEKLKESKKLNQTLNQISDLISKLNRSDQSISNSHNNTYYLSDLTNKSLNQNDSSIIENSKSQINRSIDLNSLNAFNSLNVTKNDKSNDSKPIVNRIKSDLSKITNNIGNQSQISLKNKINSTISNIEQMSFLFSIDKLINLTNDLNNKTLYINQTIHRNLSSSSNVDSLKSSKSLSEILKSSNASSMSKSLSISNLTEQIVSSNVPNVRNESTIDKIVKKIENSKRPVNNLTITIKSPNLINQLDQTNKVNLSSDYNKTELEFSSERKHSEKVLVYPVIQTNQTSNQSSSIQSKRAPHYLEEKYRVQLDKISTISSTASPDKPTPILDTKPLVEDIDNELDLKALNERLLSEDELLHHPGTGSIEDSSYEYGSGHHNSHHQNTHHSNKHHNQSGEQTNLDLSSWFKKNCLKNCTCDLNKWPEVNAQSSLKTLNCSNKEFNDYPVLINELSKHFERLSLANNNIKTFQIDADLFHCEKLIELDLSNNQLEQITANTFNHKHFQHPVVEFHPSHNHPHTESTHIIKTTTSLPLNMTFKESNSTNSSLTTKLNLEIATTQSSVLQMKNQNSRINLNKQNLFSHCHRLKILVLSGNDLSTLTTGCFRGLKRLRKLYLDNSQIKFIEKNAFLGANELRLLSLRYNMLTTIHSDMFQHMINLKVLDLTGNSLNYLGAGVFNSLVALKALHLGHNKLRQLSFQCFSGLEGLQLLTLNSNELQNVPRFSLQPLKKLKILDMSNNPISRILEDDFSHSFLQLILLNHLNQLEHVARFSFWDLPYLHEIQITHCDEFVHIDEQAIVGTPALHRLRLDHNAISQLDDRLLENLARMTIAARRQLKVYLAGNPFKCDCFLKPVYLCAHDQTQCKIELPDRENITCSFKSNPTEGQNLTTESKLIYQIDELTSNQLPNECEPTFVPIITPINVTIVKRLRSKFTLSCKAQGVPTPNVYWLQPSGEINKEKLVTRHGHDLMESDLLTLPHSFQNDDASLIGNEQAIEQNENQATAAFLPYTSLYKSLPSTAHHGSSTLRISHLTPNDAGLYTCIAENRLGESKKLVRIRSHVQLITQQLKIEIEAENTSTNFITIKWQINSIFNPQLDEILGNDLTTTEVSVNSTDRNQTDSTTDTINSTSNIKNKPKLNSFNIDFDEAMINVKNEQNLNLLDYQLLYKADSFGTDEDSKQTSAETLGSERIFETNKFFASYESVQINRQLKSFTVAGLRPGTRYKICVAVREPRLNELDSIQGSNLFRKRAIRRFRLKRNLISVESASYLAIGCLHSETVHAAFYARNILQVEKFRLPILLSNAFSVAIKVSLACSSLTILIALLLFVYTWTRQRQRRSAYETPRKTLLSIAGLSRHSNATNSSYSTPSHNPVLPVETEMESIYSPLMLAKRTRY